MDSIKSHQGDIKLAKELIDEYNEKRTSLEKQYSLSSGGVPAMEVARFSANEMAGCFLATYGFYAYSVFKQFPDTLKASYEANQSGTFDLIKRACKGLEFVIPNLESKNGQMPPPEKFNKWMFELNRFIGSHNRIEN